MVKEHEDIKRLLSIIGYGLGDNVFFKDLSSARAESVATFKSGHIIFPRYLYPKLEPSSRPFQRMVQKRANHMSLLDLLPNDLPEPERTIISEGLQRSIHTSDLIIGASAMNGYHPLALSVARGSELFRDANLLVYGPPDQELFDKAYACLWEELEAAAASSDAAYPEFQRLTRLLPAPEIKATMSDFLPSNEVQKKLLSHINKKFASALRYVSPAKQHQIYSATECREIINLILRDYGLDSYGWRGACTTTSILWSANSFTKQIRIPIHAKIPGEALRRYIIHEFGVHTLRSFNGSQHKEMPILAHSLPHNARAEEGMAILFESAIDEAKPQLGLRRAVERYVAYGLAVGLDGKPRNARELFDVLKHIYQVKLLADDTTLNDPDILSADIAFAYVDNLFRGTPFTQHGIVYSRSKLYLEGLVTMSHYFEAHSDARSFEVAFAAKYDPMNHQHVELLKKYGAL